MREITASFPWIGVDHGHLHLDPWQNSWACTVTLVFFAALIVRLEEEQLFLHFIILPTVNEKLWKWNTMVRFCYGRKIKVRENQALQYPDRNSCGKKVKKENFRMCKSWKLYCNQQIVRIFISLWEMYVAEKQTEQHSGLWGLSLKYSSCPELSDTRDSRSCQVWNEDYGKSCVVPLAGGGIAPSSSSFFTEAPWNSSFLQMGSLSVALSYGNSISALAAATI